MTYRELWEIINHLNNSQLDYDVTIYDSETKKYHPVHEFIIQHDDDILHDEHAYMTT